MGIGGVFVGFCKWMVHLWLKQVVSVVGKSSVPNSVGLSFSIPVSMMILYILFFCSPDRSIVFWGLSVFWAYTNGPRIGHIKRMPMRLRNWAYHFSSKISIAWKWSLFFIITLFIHSTMRFCVVAWKNSEKLADYNQNPWIPAWRPMNSVSKQGRLRYGEGIYRNPTDIGLWLLCLLESRHSM